VRNKLWKYKLQKASEVPAPEALGRGCLYPS
jgi:hypothetical protein